MRHARGGARPLTVAIAGLGLIGGSLAKALTRAGHRVVGVDTPRRRAAARRARAVSAIAPTLAAAARGADVVVLAAPPAANLRLLRALAADDGTVVTDVGGVKGPICAAAARRGLVRFVGGHPMAGRERSGFAAASPDLFRGCAWILTSGDARSRRTVARLARSVGARPVAMAPAAHDRAVAFLSHVPQLVSWALLRAARGDAVTRRHLGVAGPGFRGMTRLARSPRGLWREVLRQNAREVERARRALLRALDGRAR